VRLNKLKLQRLKRRRAAIVRLIWLVEQAAQRAPGKNLTFPRPTVLGRKRIG
jgi:hypothetical protein